MNLRLFFVGCVVASLAVAQSTPEREVEVAKALFDAGKYAETVALVRKALSVFNFSEAQRIELHRVAGLSSFNIGDPAFAKESFIAVLRLNPDYVLDPFIAPPPAIRLFEQVRKENADELALARQLLQVRAEQERKAAEEKRKQDERRNERRVVVVERRPMWMNFLPFGAGQFLQERNLAGVIFAISEGGLAIASVIGYWAIELLKVTVVENFDGRLTPLPDGRFERQYRAIPETAAGQRDFWNVVKYSTGATFYALWVAGALDAALRHKGDKQFESPDSALKLTLAPTPGGLFAALSLSF